MQKTASVIIFTNDRIEKLLVCLKALRLAQIDPSSKIDFETLVVDIGDFPLDTQAAMKKSKLTNLSWIAGEQWWGHARAANYAVEIAESENLFFVSDNAAVSKDLFSRPYSLDYPILAGTGWLERNSTLHMIHAGIALDSILAPVYRMHMLPKLYYQPPDQLEPIIAAPFFGIFVQKKLFTELGGLEVTYSDGLQSIDFCLRAWDKGYEVMLDHGFTYMLDGESSQDLVPMISPKPSRANAFVGFADRWLFRRKDFLLDLLVKVEGGQNAIRLTDAS
jgi:GT2 family glycosyltransferase